MIEGPQIRLRKWESKDLPLIVSLRNDDELQGKLLARVKGSSPDQVQKWLDERTAGPTTTLFIIANRHDDRALGYLQFVGLDPIDRGADLGICLAPGFEGKGLGQETLVLALNHLRDKYGIRKVNLRVRADNKIAIRCYEKVGFEQCGLLKAHVFFNDNWQDVILMEHLLTSPG